MKNYNTKRRNGGIKLSATGTAIVVTVFVIIYILDSVFGLGNKKVTGECEFHFIDVGQGDATMIITEENVVLIDTGTQDHADSLLTYVKSYTDTIDYMILTHPHEDHIGGADEIIESILVKNIIMSDADSNTYTFTKLLDAIERENINLIEGVAGDSYTAGEIEFTILSPLTEFRDYNDYSLVTKVEFGNTSAIITGDVETHSERDMLEKYSFTTLKADIFQVGHHGSYTSNSTDFIKTIDPDYAVISCGIDNEYGHPHRETLEKLKKYDITYYRTDEVGSIVFFSDGKELEYKNQ